MDIKKQKLSFSQRKAEIYKHATQFRLEYFPIPTQFLSKFI